MHCSLGKSTLLYLSAHCSRIADTSYKLVSLKDAATIFQNVILEIHVVIFHERAICNVYFVLEDVQRFLIMGDVCQDLCGCTEWEKRQKESRRRRFFDKRERSAKWVGRNLPSRYRRKIRRMPRFFDSRAHLLDSIRPGYERVSQVFCYISKQFFIYLFIHNPCLAA